MSEKIKLSILCVDDEQDIVSSLYDTFRNKYNVLTALSGEEALEMFNKEDIALVITDQRMPKMKGSELLAKINEINPLCKKILLTGFSDIDAPIDAINKGAVNKYFLKPWDEDELVRTVDTLMMKYNLLATFFEQNKDAYNSFLSIEKK